jgi:hypothetical protein
VIGGSFISGGFGQAASLAGFGNLSFQLDAISQPANAAKSKGKPAPAKGKRGSPKCAANVGLTAGAATVVGIETPALIAAGRAALTGARFGAHAGLGGVLAGAVVGGLVGGAIYYYNLDDKPVINQLDGCGGN